LYEEVGRTAEPGRGRVSGPGQPKLKRVRQGDRWAELGPRWLGGI
jgi:hypothetical protein